MQLNSDHLSIHPSNGGGGDGCCRFVVYWWRWLSVE